MIAKLKLNNILISIVLHISRFVVVFIGTNQLAREMHFPPAFSRMEPESSSVARRHESFLFPKSICIRCEIISKKSSSIFIPLSLNDFLLTSNWARAISFEQKHFVSHTFRHNKLSFQLGYVRQFVEGAGSERRKQNKKFDRLPTHYTAFFSCKWSIT